MVWKRRKELLEELAMVLVKVKAIQFGTFTLASGKISSYYIDVRTIPSYPGAYKTLIDAYGEFLKHEFKETSYDAIAGIPTAGLTLSSPIALMLEKPMIYVRKDEKDHGRGKLVEGVTRPGWNVLVIDDVITTGGSILSAIEAIRAEGCDVESASVVIDRLEGGDLLHEEAGREAPRDDGHPRAGQDPQGARRSSPPRRRTRSPLR